ncbi:MAG: sensor histidine kinase [Caldilinea sp. CFX5]|nr:sensor histidine kinase [Caldilinea sp. CFX5]
MKYRLQWQFTFAYTLVTVTMALTLAIVGLAVVNQLLFGAHPIPQRIQVALAQVAPAAAPFLIDPTPDRHGLVVWLRNLTFDLALEDEGGLGLAVVRWAPSGQASLAVADRTGHLLATTAGAATAAAMPDAHTLSLPPPAVIQAWLATPTGPIPLADGRTVVAAPVVGPDGQLLGGLLLIAPLPANLLDFLEAIWGAAILPALLAFVAFVALVGALFGLLTARWLTRRLQRLAQASDAWSRGDFARLIGDQAPDEIGQLAARLNRMAEQLQSLLQTRQALAALEERQRLARELHDAVKQQVFATAMQIGAARAQLASDPATVAAHLNAAERLAQQAQQELTGLIRALRPAALADKGLATALQDYATEWSHSTGIQTLVQVQGQRTAPLAVEQMLWRVAQETLANVARHSGAQRVDLHLAYDGDGVTLTIEDDGCGFDPARVVGKGFGLQSMQERLAAFGGVLQLDSTEAGTRLCAHVPYPDPDSTVRQEAV